MHLFFDCPFSQACWIFLGVQWDLALPPLDMIIAAREHFGSPVFREVVNVAAWSIWCHRNCIIFDNKRLSFMAWRSHFTEEMKLVTLRAKPVLKASIDSFMSSL